MRKRGLEMSFNFIVAIIIIGFIIAVVVYAISYFLSLRNCTELGLFYQDLQREVDKAWSSEIARQTITASLPGNVEAVCFGTISKSPRNEYYEDLKYLSGSEDNLFFYPRQSSCDSSSFTIDHLDEATLGTLNCFAVQDGKVRFLVSKESAASLVSIT